MTISPTSRRKALTGAAAAAVVALPVTTTLSPAVAAPPTVSTKAAVSQLDEPEIIAHRGASGYRPEHTLAAYRLAVKQGADYIEPDVVSTKDGVLVARHENEISTTTDVAERPRFANRKTTKVIDGVKMTGWFTEDFTLRELRSLNAIERLPDVRPQNTKYDGRYKVPTLREVIRLAQRLQEQTGRSIGVAPETKHPTFYDSIDLSLEEPLVKEFNRAGLRSKNDKVILQSFEISNLRELNKMTDLPLAQLMSAEGAPYDQEVAGTGYTYADMRTRAGLRKVARYAEWAAPEKGLIMPRNAAGETTKPSRFVTDAHRAGLLVTTWTARVENQFLAKNHRIGTNPNARGDLRQEILDLLDAGVDSIFADNPDIAVDARDDWLG